MSRVKRFGATHTSPSNKFARLAWHSTTPYVKRKRVGNNCRVRIRIGLKLLNCEIITT